MVILNRRLISPVLFCFYFNVIREMYIRYVTRVIFPLVVGGDRESGTEAPGVFQARGATVVRPRPVGGEKYLDSIMQS